MIISIRTDKRSEFINITSKIESMIPKELSSGLCHIFSLHTTTGITINENTDPDVLNDIITFIDDEIPWNDSRFLHFEGNSAGHIKSSLFSPSLTVPIENGKLLLGRWQHIYFCEFDGPRIKRDIDIRFSKTI